MATSRAGGLLRRPGQPQQATYLELFFDLVFVLALFRLTQGLLQNLTWIGTLRTLVLLLALWWVWSRVAGTTDRFDPQRPPIQLLVIASMLGILVMAAATPEAFGKRGLFFAGAYVAIRIGASAVLVLLLRGHQAQRAFLRQFFWYGVSAVPWIAGAVAHDTARLALWTLAVAVDYTATALRLPTPGLGRLSRSELAILGEHLAERFRQFFIIALGELILVTGLAFGTSGFGAEHSVAALVYFTTTVLLWRIYIYRAGQLLEEAIAAAPNPLRLSIAATYSHPIMVAGIVITANCVDHVLDHPFGHAEPIWIAMILGGPALFLAGRGIFEYAVFARVSRNRLIGVLVLAAISPAMIRAPRLVIAIAAALVLAAIALSDTARARGRPPEPPSPPR
ncbi:low temperature requirement protein A [Micromonospora sp. 4G57]|uniref:Low temperature requirement protein A n=1 Tax=Micromonospora sicca TaxID=2202420 RepID=A0ABU5JLX0_9ACTN|nr:MULTISPECIES: low temperature requirement protein A [unclassified Micromonospora]MDZ5446398.1 low temperature requirement protein A [Micromonospora sp. 4G57]MDZ5493413.1 low temperature requirement protein A [Micromonospora sp. 4G53]